MQVVFITGSSLGIGRATALLFAKKGYNVVVTYYKDKDEGKRVYNECKKHSDALLLKLNVKDIASITNALRKTLDYFGKVDILINNAGVIAWKALEQQSIDEINDQIDVNLKGLILTTKVFLPYVKKVINIASGAGKTGYAELSVYCATKFGVRGFTQALAKEVSIPVYSVNPGSTATRMTNFRGVDPEKVAEVILRTAEDGYGKPSGSDIDVWDYL